MENISKNKIAYDILETYRANLIETDFIDIRQIKHQIDVLRVKLIKQHLEKYFINSIDENLVQEYAPNGTAITMEIVDSSATTILPTGRYYVRSTVAIPATIERNGGIPTFTRIGPADKLSERYQIVNSDWGLLYGSGKFNSNAVAAFILGDRLILTSKNKQSVFGIKYVNVRGVFQNPSEVALLNNPLATDDDSYPINSQMIDDIKNIILNREFKLSYKSPVDDKPVNPEQITKQE